MADKRPAPDQDSKSGAVALYQRLKRPRTELVLKDRKDLVVAPKGPTRTSGLLAPNMLLSGHESGVYTCRFSPNGEFVASGSHDKHVFMWNTYGDCKNWGVLKGHTGAVLDLVWQRDGERLYTASSDKTGAIWDVETCTRVKKLRDHKSYVNCVDASLQGLPTLVTGSDDKFVFIWDTRARGPQVRMESKYAVTAVAFSADATQVFYGTLDSKIYAMDVRQNQLLYELKGHTDTLTGLRVSPQGSSLLSNAMDNTLRVWDIRPYAGRDSSRQKAVLTGHSHDFQKHLLKCSWSSDGSRVSCGSADSFVHVWDVESKQMLYKLPGHKGAVTEVDFHPKEPIIVSSCLDKTLFLGEIMPPATA